MLNTANDSDSGLVNSEERIQNVEIGSVDDYLKECRQLFSSLHVKVDQIGQARNETREKKLLQQTQQKQRDEANAELRDLKKSYDERCYVLKGIQTEAEKKTKKANSTISKLEKQKSEWEAHRDEMRCCLDEKRKLYEKIMNFLEFSGIQFGNLSRNSSMSAASSVGSTSIFGDGNTSNSVIPICFTKIDPNDSSKEFILCLSINGTDYNDILEEGTSASPTFPEFEVVLKKAVEEKSLVRLIKSCYFYWLKHSTNST